MRRLFLTAVVLAAGAAPMLAGCGDDESPSGPGGSPTASTLTLEAGGIDASVAATWTECPDGDFAEYRLYRSTVAGIEDNVGDATLVATVDTASDTTYNDAGLDWSTVYYYALRTSDTEGLHSWSNEASATTPDSGGCGYLTCYEIQGQASGSPYEGQEVTVMGVVVVGGEEYYSSSAPVAVISDPEGGPWHGLTLYGDSAASLQRGDSIMVTGEVQEYYDFTELGYITEIQRLGTGASLPEPYDISTVDLSTAGDPEQYESVLLRITDAIVTTEPDEWGVFGVDDGSGECNVDDNGDYSYTPSLGDTLNYAIGVGWYAFSEWTLQPRDDSDIDASGGGGGGSGDTLTCYEVQGQADQSPYEGETVSVTGIVTVDGDSLYSSGQAYCVMQDYSGGPWSGLVLYDNDAESLNRGDSVTVTGEVTEWESSGSYLTELSYITDVTVHETGHALPPVELLTTGELANSASPEQWEAVLVEVQNVEVTEAPGQYGEWKINDGTGECIVDDLGTYGFEPSVGDTFSSVVGIFWESYGDYKMEPRDMGDITE
ncbi:MAG: hypothetical protein R6U36_00725 [Candidatus Fermentibacteraceae bacterium]